jgi:hypothetical protein
MARRKQKGIQITDPKGKMVIELDTDIVVRRKPKKCETICIGGSVNVQNNGNVGSQIIVNLGTVNGDLYL